MIEERKGKQKTEPLYYFLKILANAGCYGIYAEVNKLQVGKNDAKKIGIFSGELSGTERTCTMEVPGPWYFPPVASLIRAGGRLLLVMLEKMVTDAAGTSGLLISGRYFGQGRKITRAEKGVVAEGSRERH
ncbi:MAG: hypothetical protein WB660_28035 [Candidatus Sulfotelmatobacter sp.]